ncbi:MPN527 family putative ECF transporter permease subunit [Mycoplasmopsis glycophila]|uniref:MPN527 family putative ECF transporter permease subunit n=1 Tax=Mycoplasmopsis glycophila TaxID=171285 RepID=UPI000480A7C0|nr:hypothetical protein [Mycoplasmopsis glycophila]
MEQNKMPHNQKRPVILSISLTAFLLAIAIILEFIGKTITIFSFLSINISLFVAFVCFFVLSFKYLNIFLLAKLLVLTFTISWSGFLINFLGVLISTLAQFFIIYFYYLFYLFFQKILKRLKIFQKLCSYYSLTFIFNYFCAMICATLIMVFLNTFVFNTLYFYAANVITKPSLHEILKNYQASFSVFFFGIKNYYLGSFVLYLTFNLMNYAINGALVEFILILEKQTQFLTKYISVYTNNKY